MATAFDTLRAATQLQEAGFEEAHARALVTVAEGAIENLATKDDLEKVATALDTRIDQLSAKMDAEFGKVRTEMGAEFGKVRTEMGAEFGRVHAEFANVRTEMDAEFSNVRAEMGAEFGKVHTEFSNVRTEMALLKRDIIIWLGGLMITLSGLVIAATSVLG